MVTLYSSNSLYSASPYSTSLNTANSAGSTLGSPQTLQSAANPSINNSANLSLAPSSNSAASLTNVVSMFTSLMTNMMQILMKAVTPVPGAANTTNATGNPTVAPANTTVAPTPVPAPTTTSNLTPAKLSSLSKPSITDASTGSNNNANPFFDYQQGSAPDCGVLSAISSIASTPQGESLLENSVHSDGNGGYDVTLQGVGATGQNFDISSSQLQDKNLSQGNPEVKAMEVAIEQHFGDSDSNYKHTASDIVPLLVPGGQDNYQGTTSNSSFSAQQAKTDLTNVASQVNNHQVGLEVAANGLPDSPTTGFHGYTVTGINTSMDTVTYENPWNANQPLTVNLDQFSQAVANGGGINTISV